MTDRIPTKIRPEDYVLDNRDDRLTEIAVDRGAEYLIIEVCPQGLMRNLLENLPVPEEWRAEYIEMFNSLAATIQEEVDDWIETH